jgi:hypothetical protein
MLPEAGSYTLDIAPNGGTELSWQEEYEKLYGRYIRLKSENAYSTEEIKALVAGKVADLKKNAPAKQAIVIGDKAYVGGIKLLPRVNGKSEAEEEAA